MERQHGNTETYRKTQLYGPYLIENQQPVFAMNVHHTTYRNKMFSSSLSYGNEREAAMGRVSSTAAPFSFSNMIGSNAYHNGLLYVVAPLQLRADHSSTELCYRQQSPATSIIISNVPLESRPAIILGQCPSSNSKGRSNLSRVPSFGQVLEQPQSLEPNIEEFSKVFEPVTGRLKSSKIPAKRSSPYFSREVLCAPIYQKEAIEKNNSNEEISLAEKRLNIDRQDRMHYLKSIRQNLNDESFSLVSNIAEIQKNFLSKKKIDLPSLINQQTYVEKLLYSEKEAFLVGKARLKNPIGQHEFRYHTLESPLSNIQLIPCDENEPQKSSESSKLNNSYVGQQCTKKFHDAYPLPQKEPTFTVQKSKSKSSISRILPKIRKTEQLKRWLSFAERQAIEHGNPPMGNSFGNSRVFKGKSRCYTTSECTLKKDENNFGDVEVVQTDENITRQKRLKKKAKERRTREIWKYCIKTSLAQKKIKTDTLKEVQIHVNSPMPMSCLEQMDINNCAKTLLSLGKEVKNRIKSNNCHSRMGESKSQFDSTSDSTGISRYPTA